MTNETPSDFEIRMKHERTLLRYSIARERSDLETMLQIMEDAETDPELQSRIMEFEDVYLREEEALAEAEQPISGIVSDLKAMGLKPVEIANTLQIDASVLGKLDLRLIDPATIPQRLINHLALVMERATGQIQAYLALPPTLAPAAMYKARRRPAVSSAIELGRESFTDAVETSAMDDDLKQFWLE